MILLALSMACIPGDHPHVVYAAKDYGKEEERHGKEGLIF
jgi:hypothetical protein